MSGYFVRFYTERGGFVSNGVAYASQVAAENHAHETLRGSRFVGAVVMHERLEITRISA